ncbi:MAG: YHYH domain-containing protein [Proteobacteria bacterium]|nr:YHYH domain-containing protein [Pseudomonadota bacterium]
MRKTIQFAVALVSLQCIVGAAFAHGGRTDGQGCHHDRRSGGYHCHGGGHVQSHSASAATLGLYSAPSRLPVQAGATPLPTPHYAPLSCPPNFVFQRSRRTIDTTRGRTT